MLPEHRARLERRVRDEGGALLRYLARRADSAERAADLLGDVHVVLTRKAARIPADATEARMWAFGIARLVVLGSYRVRQAERARLRPLAEALEVASHDTITDDQRLVRQAVRALPRRQRELVALVYWDGFTIEDAARLLHVRPSTARTHLQRARAALAERLADAHPASDVRPEATPEATRVAT